MRNVFVLLLLCLSTHLSGQTSENRQFVEELIGKYRTHQSISYEIAYQIKFFDHQEPMMVNSKVDILKAGTDTVFKGTFVYNRSDSMTNVLKYYRPGILYVIDLNMEHITRFDASRNQTSPVTGNIDGAVLQVYFLDMDRLSKKLDNPDNKVDYKDSAGYLSIRIHYPDDEDFHDCIETICIDRTDKIIREITYQARYHDQVQNNHWKLSNIVFDEVREEDIAMRVAPYLQAFKTEDYKPLTEEDYKLLENGTTAPGLTGKIFPDYSRHVAVDWNKIIILDFWYTSCMPCMKTIPHLNRLKQKYGDRIRIIGVNAIENKEQHREKIDAFLKRTPMDYPVLLVEEIPGAYNIRAYPTLYIIKDGKVAFSKLGLSENIYEEIDAALSRLVRED